MNGFPETNICLDTKTEMRQLIHGSFVINDKKNMLNMLFKKILNLKDKQGTKAEKIKCEIHFLKFSMIQDCGMREHRVLPSPHHCCSDVH